MKIHYPVLVFAAVMLSACGGGGGGSSSNTASNMPETPETSASRTNFGAAPDTLNLDPNTVDPYLKDSNASNVYEDAIQGAATAIPRFGSITQSSNVDAQGLTTDHATGSFDGNTATITVTRADGSSFSFGEAFPAYWGPRDFTQAYLRKWAVSSHDSGRRSYHSRTLDDGSYHADYVGVSWNSANTNEYAVWGYWLRSDGPFFEPGVAFEIGAFNDGPTMDPANPPTLPESGTATYTGEGQGIYHHQYGPGPEYGEYAGAIEIGQYVVPYEVTVDFGQSSIEVCGNCGTPSEYFGLWGDGRKTDGTFYRFDAVPTAYRLEGTATVNSDGSFRSQQVTLTNPDKPVTSFEGSMGGLLSNVPDASGNPEGLAGTNGGTYTHAGGESGSFVGTFGAVLSP
ncbi:MAG: hypothetical protein OXG03_00590 [Gammaproteobacteria bacterium]|nr:hypothetical protein [Gammaproteobacteria bacterium]